jgi:hypothetical protein
MLLDITDEPVALQRRGVGRPPLRLR